MNKAVADDDEGIGDLNNNSDGLGKVESISNIALEEEEEFFDAMEDVSNVEEESDLDLATSEEEESISDLEEVEEFFDSNAAAFSVPLSIFHYKDYDSDFFTSWYNMSSGILKEINRTCPEKKVLNLALSVLMLPYIAFTALGLVVYSRLNSKKQEGVGEDKTKKSETGVPKRLAYGVLAAIAIFVNVAVLTALVIPATVALATFYLLNRDLSHSLVAAFKISMGQYSNKHQNIEVSFRETEVSGPSIAYDMEIKFPPQFKRLLIDLCENENNQWFSVTRDSEHNTILKLSTNINLKNGLKPLRNEIKDVLAISIQEFAKAMEELMKLEKKEITYDKLKELLDEFRLKVVDSIGSKLTTHLIENAYQVAFIQAIKFQQNRRGEDFSLEDELRDILVKQELKSQGKELPSEKAIIKQTLKNLGKEDKREISRVVDVCEIMYPEDTGKALDDAKKEIEYLREIGQKRYDKICEKLKEVYENRKNSNLKDGILKRELEDLFKFEYSDQEVEKKLIESRIRKAKVVLSQSGVLEKQGLERFKQRMRGMWNSLFHKDKEQSLMTRLKDLEKNEKTSDKIDDFIEEAYPEIIKHKVQNLFEQQKKILLENIKDLVSSLDEPEGMYDGEDNELTLLFRRRSKDIVHLEKTIKECLEQKEYDSLKEKIEKQREDIRKSIRDNKDPLYFLDKDLIGIHLDSNEKLIKLLEQLKSEKEGLLINEKTKNNYREELESREKIKFAIIEDDLLKAFGHETFDEEAIKKLLEKAELEYYLAEKCIKSPVIKMKDNIKHFSQNLLSPLIDRLVDLIINNVPKDNENGWSTINWYKNACIAMNYNKFGLLAVKDENSTEGKALNVAHDTHKEVETFLQHFRSSYEEIGVFLGNLFSDDGTTFKNDVWPKVEEHLHGMLDRFFKDIEFKIGNKLDEVNVTQQNQGTVITA